MKSRILGPLAVAIMAFVVAFTMMPEAGSEPTVPSRIEEPTQKSTPRTIAHPAAPATGQGATVQSTDTPTQTLLPLAGKVIVVDAGHGGTQPGAVRSNVMEKELTLAISLKLAEELRALGATVSMTRDDDSDVPLEDRVALVNELKPDLFLSVHINANPQPRLDGIETYYYSAESACPARAIYDALVRELKEPGNWVAQKEFYVVHRATVPAVLAEVGYLSRPSKRVKLTSAYYQEQVAKALSAGVTAYFTRPCPELAPQQLIPAGAPSVVPAEPLSFPVSVPKKEP